eukprot:CAMPEP_0202969082 /NCGR_PEP_ID=MMETSP1396-20130829/14678_1 /ASSEMBLY_ACC=CAM_ASM_000872 /TAXON_ID= /ORGANISM="Pseudokeronopsis sp., Strain Brazil" /LENGTH=57 /DNA_ID=CAMNT_0049696187 /DNA_START=58 /DNA_END=227 /DNA_ORIENTATION=+
MFGDPTLGNLRITVIDVDSSGEKVAIGGETYSNSVTDPNRLPFVGLYSIDTNLFDWA